MNIGLRLFLGVLAIALVALVGIRIFQVPISKALLDRQLAANMDRDVIGSLPEGLHVGLCGSGGPFPNPDRSASCIFVIAGERFFVIDSGSGASGKIGMMGLGAGRIEAIFLTHFHSDHIDGLGEVMMNRWVQSNAQTPVPVYGPVGVETVVEGLRMAYAFDSTYRTAHHGAAIAPPSGAGGIARAFDLGPDASASQVILDDEGLRVTAFNVDHSPIDPAVGYKFEYGGRSVVISGDTVASDTVLEQSRGADVLVHEVLQPNIVKRFEVSAKERGLNGLAKIMSDIPDYHTTPEEAAAIAVEAGVKHLLFYHIVPPLPKFFNKLYLSDANKLFDGPITVGTDGVMLSLPSGDDRVELRSLL